MIEPQGPLPSEVYWRRRLMAIVGGLVTVAVVVALIVWAAGSSDSSDPKFAAEKDGAPSSSSSAAAPKPPAPSSTQSAPPSSEPVTGGGQYGAGGDPNEPANPANPPAPGAPAGGGAAPTGADPNACADQALSVVLYTDKPTYSIGDQPVFTLVLTNGAIAQCNRDIGKNAQNVIVRSLDGARTLWAAQDCAPDKAVNQQQLAPGQQFSDTITWSGTTSNPGCNKPRLPIPVGAYQAVAKIGEKESAPITFNVVKPAQQ